MKREPIVKAEGYMTLKKEKEGMSEKWRELERGATAGEGEGEEEEEGEIEDKDGVQNNELEGSVENVETTGVGRGKVLHIKGLRGKEGEMGGGEKQPDEDFGSGPHRHVGRHDTQCIHQQLTVFHSHPWSCSTHQIRTLWAKQQVNKERINAYLADKQCDFLVNVPGSSHVGGIWERQIRTVRGVLCSVMAHCDVRLDDGSLRTFLYEAMSIVNNHPLTVDKINDPTSLEPLTPNHLITMKSSVPLPPPGKFVKEDLYASRGDKCNICLNNSGTDGERNNLLTLLLGKSGMLQDTTCKLAILQMSRKERSLEMNGNLFLNSLRMTTDY
ncbi:hypothetical protein FQN60_007708 [Etheostoma spectabile]|uniref:Uncharacterized protein n=1 Tax=Etheostoma spectabile TaxID=54343 RepID=A0A5J5CYA7_9PERO|nr:hypothetical protein FQN60_007708 [Etheostoma spectabile]